MSQRIILEEGSFYCILDDGKNWILEDKTKRGLKALQREGGSLPIEEMGRIYDAEGKGHWVVIRWIYPKTYQIDMITEKARQLEEKYRKMKEETCPD